jgi:LysM repeat protein
MIRAHLQPDYSDVPPPARQFEAYVNPSEITYSYEGEYAAQSGVGTTSSRMEFKRMKPGDLSLSFFIDGTGANGREVHVQEEIAKFQAVAGYSGQIHRPHYLEVAYGKVPPRRCVLKSASIAYKLFRSDGIPLRAVISATFTENSDDTTRVATAQDKSADLTHVRLVKAGDTLPGLCETIYGEPRMYLEVARANGLDNFRALPAGLRLRFPPLEK